MSETTLSNSLDRRSFVKSIGALGALAAATVPMVALADEEDPFGIPAGDSYAFEAVEGSGREPGDYTDEELDRMLAEMADVTEDLVLEDGTVVPAVYVKLRNRINRTGAGIGNAPRYNSYIGWGFLLENFTEEEAQFFVDLPSLQYFQAAELVETTGMDEADLVAKCEDLAMRGFLYRVRRSGVTLYCQAAWVHGIWEFNMNRFFEPDFVPKLAFMTEDDTPGLYRGTTPPYHPLPVSHEIVSDAQVLPFDDIWAIIDRNEIMAVSPCQCRTAREVLDMEDPNCTHPRETCMSFGECAAYYIENGIGRQVDRDEARQIIQRSIDAGMVINSEFTKQNEVICSCHSDCCFHLAAIRAVDGDFPAMYNISNYLLELDKDVCIKCGACAERCPLKAISFDEDGYPQMDNACVRCGQCAYVCPVGARSLHARPDQLEYADDMLGDYILKARDYMARGYIQDLVG